MKVAIHQPNYLPWSGYFYKMALSDCFVLLDDAQFTKNGYQNRVKIKTPQGEHWLTQPVRLSDGSFRKTSEIRFANSSWVDQHGKTLKANYARSRFFSEYCSRVIESIAGAPELLAESNIRVIREIAKILGIETKIVLASDFSIESNGTQRLIDIVNAVGGDTYVHGRGGLNYQDNELFSGAGISLLAADFVHPVYPQCWGDFIEGLSIVDLIFNCGPDSLKMILEANSPNR